MHWSYVFLAPFLSYPLVYGTALEGVNPAGTEARILWDK